MISGSFATTGPPCRDEADCAAALGVDDGDEPAVQLADGKAPGLAAGGCGFELQMGEGEERGYIGEVDWRAKQEKPVSLRFRDS